MENKRQPLDMYIGRIVDTKSAGTAVIVEYISALKIKLRFTDTGSEGFFCAAAIRDGEVRDKLKPSVYGVGFIGVGEYGSRGKDSKAYQCWHSMMTRCYSEKYKKGKPTYEGCTVCDEWHNFQNFAEWFYDNYPNDGKDYQLDKDIKIDGNRIYRPEACSFVTCQENSEKAWGKDYRFISPSGLIVDIHNLEKFCRDNNLTAGLMRHVMLGKQSHHKGWRKCSDTTEGSELSEGVNHGL